MADDRAAQAQAVDLDVTAELERSPYESGDLPPHDQPRTARPKRRFKPVGFTIKLLLLVVAIYIFAPGLITNFQGAGRRLRSVEPGWLVLGFGLQLGGWTSYSLLTRAALGQAIAGVSFTRFFRIQMSTKALSNLVPGGNAAASALAYRLLTLSGIRGADAGFALATAGLGSAVVLNLIFWIGLIVSIPIRGVNPGYALAAVVGVVLMLLAAGLVISLMHGQGRAERILRWICGKLRLNPDSAAAVLRQLGTRMEELVSDRALLKRVVLFAAVQWTCDAASLWVFLRAFGEVLDPDALIVAFGLANIIAVVPVTPGGLGIVDGYYIPTLVAFGITRKGAGLGVAAYRMAQFLFPILLGGLLYASLRIGPWSIERRDRLSRLRDIARTQTQESESRVEFALRRWERSRRADVAAPPDPYLSGLVPPPLAHDPAPELPLLLPGLETAEQLEAEAEASVDRPEDGDDVASDR